MAKVSSRLDGITELLREQGGCGAISPDGERACIMEPHDGLHGWERDPEYEWAFPYPPPFSAEAERLSWPVSHQRLGWIQDDDGQVHAPMTAHDEHIYDGACAICKAGNAPIALRVVIDAVLAASRHHIGASSDTPENTPQGQ